MHCIPDCFWLFFSWAKYCREKLQNSCLNECHVSIFEQLYFVCIKPLKGHTCFINTIRHGFHFWVWCFEVLSFFNSEMNAFEFLVRQPVFYCSQLIGAFIWQEFGYLGNFSTGHLIHFNIMVVFDNSNEFNFAIALIDVGQFLHVYWCF